jgi:iduronate 2-sulfatase
MIKGIRASEPNRNLVFLFGESLRPDSLEAYYGPAGVTPTLNTLFAQRGSIIVDHAYVNYPLCNPSRASILLGRTPDSTNVKTNFLNWKEQPGAKTWLSLPRFLKQQGYVTLGGGKVFHKGSNDDAGWSALYDSNDDIDERDCIEDKLARPLSLQKGESMPYIVGCQTTANDMPDLKLSDRAARAITKHARKFNHSVPFALFVGFHAPHFPVRVSRQFFVDRSVVAHLIPEKEARREPSQFVDLLSFTSPKPYVVKSSMFHPERRQIPDSAIGGDAFSGPGPSRLARENLRMLHLAGVGF